MPSLTSPPLTRRGVSFHAWLLKADLDPCLRPFVVWASQPENARLFHRSSHYIVLSLRFEIAEVREWLPALRAACRLYDAHPDSNIYLDSRYDAASPRPRKRHRETVSLPFGQTDAETSKYPKGVH